MKKSTFHFVKMNRWQDIVGHEQLAKDRWQIGNVQRWPWQVIFCQLPTLNKLEK